MRAILPEYRCIERLAVLSEMDHHIISNVFGTLGAVCWSVQLTPQIIMNWRRHSAAGLSSAFMLFWASAGVPLGVYNIVSNFNIALRVQPQILTSLSLITWGQCYYYERKWTVGKVLCVAVPLACMMGGLEAALVFALRIGIQHGTTWPLTLMAVLTALLLALGVLEQYLAIWKQRSVEGISFLFCGIDALGDLTSIISVVFQPTLDILGAVIYGVELILWLGIFACGCYFKLVPWLTSTVRRRRTTSTVGGAATDVHTTGLSLHDMPSSTSVFRTASGTVGLRSRGPRSPESS